jgi:hypothetical protein
MSAVASFINTMLDTSFTGTITMKLFRVGLPSTTGVEVSGGSYAAQTLTFSSASGKVKAASSVTFTNLPTGQTIVAYGIYKAGVLVDEGNVASFTPDVTNNSLTITYSFSLAGV